MHQSMNPEWHSYSIPTIFALEGRDVVVSQVGMACDIYPKRRV